jgi:TRAP-type mannitol/chloroaromatic compound transport system permease small subunit
MHIVRWIAAALSQISVIGSIMSLVALVTALLYEVVARYGLNAPTIWAYDVAGFLTATTFLLACAWCERNDRNIRIDALVARVSPRVRAIIEAIFLAVLLLPALAAIDAAALSRAYKAFVTGEVDPVSPWGPRVWPFYFAVALALTALWLQCFVSMIDAVIRAREAPPLPESIEGEGRWKLSG